MEVPVLVRPFYIPISILALRTRHLSNEYPRDLYLPSCVRDTTRTRRMDLGFLEAVMSELVDEAEALQADLSQSLKTFNESFASFLYAPTDASFRLARRMAEENARMAAEVASKAVGEVSPTPPPGINADKITYTENADYKMMFITTANVTSTRQLQLQPNRQK
ncbi:hypothetical protein EDD16DRAFT_1578248 [Pisolithus croceorrhizus]|nr:hypothetical protein EDD16DRAFT_1578248 [Pisolithus croceorrhizus]